MIEAAGKRRQLGRWATAAIAVVGILAAGYLVVLHNQIGGGESVDAALCGIHTAVDCDSVMRSRYSEWFGVPIALLGLSFYVAVLSVVVFDSAGVRKTRYPFRPAAIGSTTFAIGVVVSLFLAGVSVFELGTLCPFCAILYAVNLLGLVSASFWAGQAPHRVFRAQIQDLKASLNRWSALFILSFGMAMAIGLFAVGEQGGDDVPRPEPQRALPVESDATDHLDPGAYRSADAPGKGAVDAPVHVVEFSNFPCPFCGRLAESLDRLHAEYGEDVRIEFRHFPMDNQEHGHRSARAAYCADEQDAFWSMHDELFAHAPAHSPEDLRRYADGVGLDRNAFDECIDSARARAYVDRDVAAAAELGIRGTPTFFVNGQRFQGALPYEVLEEIVVKALDEPPN